MVRYDAAFPVVSDGIALIALMRCLVCAPDRIESREAVGVYRGGVDQGGVSPENSAQNKKGGSAQTPSTRHGFDVASRLVRHPVSLFVWPR